jgi:hypothetical protein
MDTGLNTKPAAHAAFLIDDRPFPNLGTQGQAREGTCPNTHATNKAVVRIADVSIHPRRTHLHLALDSLAVIKRNAFEGSGGAGLGALHTEDAGLLPGDNIRGIISCKPNGSGQVLDC